MLSPIVSIKRRKKNIWKWFTKKKNDLHVDKLTLDELSNSGDDQGKTKQETQPETSKPSNKSMLNAMSKHQQKMDIAAYCIVVNHIA